MKKLFCTTLLLLTIAIGFAQGKNDLWKKSNSFEAFKKTPKNHLPQKNIFKLDLLNMEKMLNKAPKRANVKITQHLIITLPNGEGVLENFKVFENSVMEPELAKKYPNIKSYVAVGIDNPLARAYFSYSPLGFKSMILYPDQSSVFIEPISDNSDTYSVYKKSDKKEVLEEFECNIMHKVAKTTTSDNTVAFRGADDAKLRTFRIALSSTGEYSAYFGGTKANTLAAMNNTLTRINGIFEKDFGVRLILIGNNDAIIYTNSTTDPYSDPANKSNWRLELQSNLTATIGEANYDIGHLLGTGVANSGDAGCVGCICTNNFKGRGYTTGTSNNHQGDTFDLDFVAHEIGHQLGATHTFTHTSETGTGSQMEPGSGSTIMSYSGRTSKDIEFHSDAYFHAISIQQVTDNIKTKTCAVISTNGNAAPIVNAGLDFTIPKGTPFMLTGTATDANSDDILTYSWEQMDLGTSTTSVPNATATSGPLFRSYPESTSATRYFPNINSILNGLTTTTGREIASEVLPNVARTLNFRFTVRDNRIGGGSNNSDDMIITVDGLAGPFTVDSQNTAVSYAAGTSQTINWSVAGTDTNGVNCTNVDILLSMDGGQTFPIVLLASTPNDGSQNIIIPNMPGTTNRIMVKGSNHIFFDVNNSNFTITGSNTDTTAPTTSTLTASGTTTSSTNLSWTPATDNVGVSGYDVYQNGILRTSTTTTTLSVTGLTASTTYNFYIKAKDAAGNTSQSSNTVSVTTLSPADTTAPSTSTLTASGTTTSSTNLSWTAATDNVGVSGYDVYQNGVLRTSTTSTTLSVTGLTASTTYNFYIKAKDAAGNTSQSSNTLSVTTLSPTDTTAPSTSTLTASGTTTSSTNLSWTPATDNVGVSGYDVYQNGVLRTSTTTTTLSVTGLTASTTYNFYVKAKDAAGNTSQSSNTVIITTLSNTTLVTTPSYCSSVGGTSKEYINRVIMGTIDNNSGNDNGYGNYTILSSTVYLGSSEKITIIPKWTSSVRAESYNVWIDFNKNGNFESNELVFSKSKSRASSVTGAFTIPSNALTGATRMRVSMKYNSFPSACETFANGEVEDYTINITSTIARTSEETNINEETKEETNEISKLDFKLYPNPVKGDIVNFTEMNESTTYRIFNQMGQQVASGYIENNSVNVGALMPAIYIIEITDGKSVGTKRFIKE
jgi:chitodextrinase